MVGFYKDAESIVKSQSEYGLQQLMHYCGIELELIRNKAHDVYNQVHGQGSGAEGVHLFNFVGVLENDDLVATGGRYSGNFETGFLYTENKEIKSGDIISIVSDDDKARRYHVRKTVSIGFTTEVFTRWEISSIGD